MAKSSMNIYKAKSIDSENIQIDAEIEHPELGRIPITLHRDDEETRHLYDEMFTNGELKSVVSPYSSGDEADRMKQDSLRQIESEKQRRLNDVQSFNNLTEVYAKLLTTSDEEKGKIIAAVKEIEAWEKGKKDSLKRLRSLSSVKDFMRNINGN